MASLTLAQIISFTTIKMKCVVLLFAALFWSTEAANLPSYISQCCASSPNVQKCYIEQIKKVIPLMLGGDKYYNVPCMLPYIEPQRVLLNNGNGRCVLYTVRAWGLDSIEPMGFNLNFDKGFGNGQYHIHSLRLQFTYNINIPNTPLVGYGCGRIHLDDLHLSHSVKFALDKEGYAHVTDASVRFTASNIAYKLENLCEEANEYLQNNLDELHELFEPKLRSLLCAILTSPIRSYAELIKLRCAVGFGRDCKKC